VRDVDSLSAAAGSSYDDDDDSAEGAHQQLHELECYNKTVLDGKVAGQEVDDDLCSVAILQSVNNLLNKVVPDEPPPPIPIVNETCEEWAGFDPSLLVKDKQQKQQKQQQQQQQQQISSLQPISVDDDDEYHSSGSSSVTTSEASTVIDVIDLIKVEDNTDLGKKVFISECEGARTQNQYQL
jgi:hypothetical protein